ncbi:SDR family oxidoreductase [Microbulbifer rhizosphaerae]|uniref:Short-subunit dehydrogenase involved in D-alanine esterification of teichoic acids n=1 Tax=Microbulbifer rhizosphaerae TaxID=1562603 RepID=A0A7W4WE78_9GAMM|nr:SDR family NAD(P)-dependent oxidoreductase [Microbulbifer rhizosphaerae]MBB3061926.1 short-subunit dehydrogenase involved in D-alanine esterification of teichoic acids [Microbulbifer rhizosphaerae]
MNMTGKTVLLTGGTSGIGLALLPRLIERGCRVITCGRDGARIKELRGSNPQAIFVRADINSAEGIDALAQAVSSAGAGLDMIINNAGIQLAYEFVSDAEVPDKIDREVGINLCAQMKLAHRFLPELLIRPEAVIVNITSCLAVTPKRSAPVYCATKAAMRSFTRALRYQLEDSTVRVVEVIPPLVATRMTAGRDADTISSDEFAEEMLSKLVRGDTEIRVGKARLLMGIYRLWPALAARILKNG